MSSIFASISRIGRNGRHIYTVHMQISLDVSKNRNKFGRTRQVLGSPWKNKDRSFPQRGSAEAECLSVKKIKRCCAKGEGETNGIS